MRLVVLTCVLLAFTGCAGGGGSGTSLERGPTVAGFAFTDRSSVAEAKPIDPRFSCDGDDLAPGVSWTGMPDGTRELALVLEDPDAPGNTFTHWLVYGLEPEITELAEEQGTGWTGYAPLVVREGQNDFGDTGYGGPCPPGGEEHDYVFRLFALDAPSGLEAGADRAAFDDAVDGHVLAEARLVAPYARQG